jgi:putative SOS response-associated peptidase YedK
VCRRYADKPENIGEIEELEQCNLEANYKVISNNNVKVITRSQTENKHMAELLEGWDSETIKEKQKNDKDIGTIYNLIENEQAKPTWREISEASPHTKVLWAQWDRLSIHSGMLYRNMETAKKRSTQL